MAGFPSNPRATQPLRCLIIDDEPVAVRGIVNYVRKTGFLEVADTCASALQAATFLKTKEVDLMFLDINMPHLSGLDFLESLDHAPLTILTTAYSEYALEGYRLNVVDYLLKPVSFQRFFQAASKAQDLFNVRRPSIREPEADNSGLYVRQGDSFRKISLEDILYIEGMQNYLKLYLKEEVLVIHQTMVSLEDTLPKDRFFRIHRSYLVNLAHIDAISGGRMKVKGKELPVAATRKEEFLKQVVYKNLISK